MKWNVWRAIPPNIRLLIRHCLTIHVDTLKPNQFPYNEAARFVGLVRYHLSWCVQNPMVLQHFTFISVYLWCNLLSRFSRLSSMCCWSIDVVMSIKLHELNDALDSITVRVLRLACGFEPLYLYIKPYS